MPGSWQPAWWRRWRQQNDSVAAATCAYLALRLPELKQVRADRKDGQLHIDLVFDQPHVHTQTVHFVRPGGGLH
ncbi:MAG: hypothetical protein MZV65_41165 [Chromatiales bacterium]|nr:hypothetical protein [Chromatiales bacterium]